MGWLWHRRLGHVGMKQLNKLLRHNLVRGLKEVTLEKDKPCSACQAGKQGGNAHPSKSVLMQKWICKPKGLIPNLISKACQSI
jgi:hypothetical protein